MTTLLRTSASAAILALSACSGEVTDGGTGSDTDPERIADRSAVLAEPEMAEQDGAAAAVGQPIQEGADAVQPGELRAEDYPTPGQEATRNPIEPGNEEPGGKDMLLAKEYEAMGVAPPTLDRGGLEEARAAATDATVTHDGRIYLSHAGLSAKGLMDAKAYGLGGEEAAEVRDLVLSDDGRLVGLVLRDEGPLGLVGEQHLLPASEVVFSSEPGRQPRVRTELRADQMDAYQEFDEDQLPAGTYLASEFIASAVQLGADETAAAVYDVILNRSGEVRGVALSHVGQYYAVGTGALQRAEGDGGYLLTLNESQLQAQTPYVGEPAYEAD